jgi:hypothetical protein
MGEAGFKTLSNIPDLMVNGRGHGNLTRDGSTASLDCEIDATGIAEDWFLNGHAIIETLRDRLDPLLGRLMLRTALP